MESRESGSVLGSPSLTNIRIYELEDREVLDRALESIRRDYAANLFEEDRNIFKINLKDAICNIELTVRKDCTAISTSIRHPCGEHASKEWQKDLERYRNQLQTILSPLPKNPISSFSVLIGKTSSEREALKLVRTYSDYVGSREVAAGIAGNCLLATFGKAAEEIDPGYVRRELLLSPMKMPLSEMEKTVSQFLNDIKHLAINQGKLDRLQRLCQPYFPQIDPGETEIQEKIENIMGRITQTEPVDLETLKSWLSEVMERFSTVSTLSALIKRDQATAANYIEENKNLLSQWSERSIEGYPTNTIRETIEYSDTLRPFQNFIERTEALRIQLERVSDFVRTYLGIRQQEQSSETLGQQVKMLHAIEKHEKLLKDLTWIVALLTVTLVLLELARTLHILP